MWKRFGLCSLLVLAACKADDGETGGVRSGYPFADPASFARVACDEHQPLADLDPAGIWHVDLHYPDFGPSIGPVRIDEEPGGSLSGLLFGHLPDEVWFDGRDLFLRQEIATAQGEVRVRALAACARTEDGTIVGDYATCTGPSCAVATFAARKVEPLDEPVSSGLALIAEHAGPPEDPWPRDRWRPTVNVRRHGEVAYLVRGLDGLRIVDISDPAAPADLGHAPVAFEDREFYNDVKIAEGPAGEVYALVASNLRGAVVLDVTDPGAPVEVRAFPEDDPTRMGRPLNVHTLFLEGGRAYLANISTAGLDIFDIEDPASPVRLGAYVHPDISTLGGFVHDLFVEDGRVYLNYWNRGMVVVDAAADPESPEVVGVFDDYERRTSHSSWATVAGGRQIAVHGDEDYGAHVRIVDVEEGSPTFMREIGSYETRPEVSVHNVMAFGELALITYYQDGLRVLDLEDPTEPREIAHYHTWPGPLPGYGASFFEGAIGVDYELERGRAYVADTHRGLLILDLER